MTTDNWHELNVTEAELIDFNEQKTKTSKKILSQTYVLVLIIIFSLKKV